MTVTDLGLIENGAAYRTRVECDVESCPEHNLIDTDRIFVDEIGADIDVRAAQLNAFIKTTGGLLVDGADGLRHYYCAAHRPEGD